jgi:hypothetical protein
MRDQDDSLYPFFNNLPEAQSGADLLLNALAFHVLARGRAGGPPWAQAICLPASGPIDWS